MAGFGEAMLIGAAVGGGTALVTGQDPLKGALMGGITGGITKGIPLGGTESLGPLVEPGTQAAADLGSFAASDAGRELASVSAAAPQIANAVPAVAETANKGIMGGIGDWYGGLSTPEKIGVGIGGSMVASSLLAPGIPKEEETKGPFTYNWRNFRPSNAYAEGGITKLAAENMSSGLHNPYVSNQGPLDQQAVQIVPSPDGNNYDNAPAAGYTGQSVKMMASGGISDLGGYSDGGRLLKGPGDGMSDHIPASIGGKQPARLADGEFVIPADVVSHLGNGSTDAGAKHLYKMMNKVRKARTGNPKQGKQINPAKYMVA